MAFPSNQLITLLMKLKKCLTAEDKDTETYEERGLHHFSYTNEREGENR